MTCVDVRTPESIRPADDRVTDSSFPDTTYKVPESVLAGERIGIIGLQPISAR